MCAVSGKPWSGRPARDPQNYVVLPRQPWLDGINSGKGTVRQFVAVPLGLGATVEGQVTGEEVWGGVQLQSFPLNDGQLARWREEERLRAERSRRTRSRPAARRPRCRRGAAAAVPTAAPPSTRCTPGTVRARIRCPAPPAYRARPPHRPPRRAPGSAPRRPPRWARRRRLHAPGGLPGRPAAADWAEQPAGRVFVHLVTPPEWRRITGEAPPPSPVDRAAYTRAGLPWFDYYDQDAQDLAPTDTLEAVKPVGDWLGDDHEPWQAARSRARVTAARGRAGPAGRGRGLVDGRRQRVGVLAQTREPAVVAPGGADPRQGGCRGRGRVTT